MSDLNEYRIIIHFIKLLIKVELIKLLNFLKLD